MKIYKIIIIILFFLTNIYAAGPRIRPENWGKQVLSDKVKNWYKIDDRLYRSAQPDEEGMKEIEQFGIKSILNLREFHSDDDEIKNTHFKTYRIIINAGEIKDEDIIEALRIIKNSESPILVHCCYGSDRTGTIIAMYRIVEMGWSKEDAIDELVNGGYGYHSMYDNILKYIKNVNIDVIKKEVGNPLTLKPFITDGCSRFPNGTFKNKNLWVECCTEHDIAYWKGGTYDERLEADRKLKACVEKLGEPIVAEVMYEGVRIGGSPIWSTNYRWGYGWQYDRGYKALTENEKKQVEKELKK